MSGAHGHEQRCARHAPHRRPHAARIGATLLVSLALALLAACRDTPLAFRNTAIADAELAPTFMLTDHTGRIRTPADFAGRLLVVSFGFTHCPVVCPTMLADLKEAMARLGERAEEVQVAFVTLDPERDTRAVLARYVPAFDMRFLGLRGSEAATAAAAGEFHVFHERVPGATPDDYTVDHTATAFVLDRRGRLRLMIGYGAGAESMAHDLALLLDA